MGLELILAIGHIVIIMQAFGRFMDMLTFQFHYGYFVYAAAIVAPSRP